MAYVNAAILQPEPPGALLAAVAAVTFHPNMFHIPSLDRDCACYVSFFDTHTMPVEFAWEKGFTSDSTMAPHSIIVL
jgi:hypothetical protein